MLIYEASNYRKALRNLITREKAQRGSQISMGALAKAAKMQPSYLTNATKERAHLSADQIYALGERLGLNPEETNYLVLLMEWERAAYPRRKEYLSRKLEKIRRKNLNAEKYLSAKRIEMSPSDLERYYLDPNVELLHMFLSTDSCPRDLPALSRAWGLQESYLAGILHLLEELKLIKRKGDWWSAVSVSQHLPRESPLCRPQQMMKRIRAMQMLQALPPDRVYSFSASITMSEETRLEIQGLFIEFLKRCEELVAESAPRNLFQIQFDLFPWTG